MKTCFIGLGSNVGDCRAQLLSAVNALHNLQRSQVTVVSPFYRSAALVTAALASAPQPDYFNAVIAIETHLTALDLLDQLQKIELAHLRVRVQHWGPRTLDLDMLLYGNDTIISERLTVPHYALQERAFVVIPLYDIAPDLVLPCGVSLRKLRAHFADNCVERLAA